MFVRGNSFMWKRRNMKNCHMKKESKNNQKVRGKNKKTTKRLSQEFKKKHARKGKRQN